jgi:hypothetical protein
MLVSEAVYQETAWRPFLHPRRSADETRKRGKGAAFGGDIGEAKAMLRRIQMLSVSPAGVGIHAGPPQQRQLGGGHE